MLVAMGLQLIIKAPITAIWAVSKILGKSLTWSAVIGGGVLILLLTLTFLMIVVLPKFKIVQKLLDKINGITRENLTGIRVVRAFNAEDYQEKKFEETNSKLTKIQLFNQRTFGIMQPIMYLIMYFSTLAIYFIGAYMIDASLMSEKVGIFGDMVVFSSYGMQVIMSFLMLAMIFIMYPRAAISADRINEILDEDFAIKDGSVTKSDPKLTGTVEFFTTTSIILFAFSKSVNSLLPSPFFTTFGAGHPMFISIISAKLLIYFAPYAIASSSLPNI